MKLLPVLFLSLTVAAGVSFAAFSIPWSSLDGGGGKSTGTTGSGTLTLNANPAVTRLFFRLRKP